MSRPNFRIIENQPSKWEEKYEEFIDLYENSTLSVMDIRNRLGLSSKQFAKARDKAKREGKITLRNERRAKQYYFNKQNKKWYIYKQNNKKLLTWQVSSEDEAIQMRDYLDEHGWTNENVEEFRKGKR